MGLRFGMSARKGKNGFLSRRIVSSGRLRRNIRGEIVNIFNMRKMPGFQDGKSSAALVKILGRAQGNKDGSYRAAGTLSGLFAGGGEQVAAAPDGADHRRLGRV